MTIPYRYTPLEAQNGKRAEKLKARPVLREAPIAGMPFTSIDDCPPQSVGSSPLKILILGAATITRFARMGHFHKVNSSSDLRHPTPQNMKRGPKPPATTPRYAPGRSLRGITPGGP
jgi:hypothetical protein